MGRTFTLANPDYQANPGTVHSFAWDDLEDKEIVFQLCYQEQFLEFFRHLIDNLQSNSNEHPNGSSMPLKSSLRAGALKTYVQSASSIVEGALAELAVKRGYGSRESLHRMTFGNLLELWRTKGNEELVSIWNELLLLKKYRNFIHLGNAAANPDSHWKHVVNKGHALLEACDEVIGRLTELCNGLPEENQC